MTKNVYVRDFIYVVVFWVAVAFLIFLSTYQLILVAPMKNEQTQPLLTQSECLELVNRAMRWEE